MVIMQVFTPRWFYGYDALFELVSIASVILIAYLSIRSYRFSRNRNFKYLALSFFLIGLSFIIKIFTSIIAYSQPLIRNKMGFFIMTAEAIESLTITYTIGYLLYRISILLGFFILLSLALKIKDSRQILLFTYFLIISTIFSSLQYFIFHITCAIMLVFITQYFYNNYRKRKTESRLTLALSFFLITLSQVVFIFVIFNNSIYVIGEVFQLLGYLILLYTYLLILNK